MTEERNRKREGAFATPRSAPTKKKVPRATVNLPRRTRLRGVILRGTTSKAIEMETMDIFPYFLYYYFLFFSLSSFTILFVFSSSIEKQFQSALFTLLDTLLTLV